MPQNIGYDQPMASAMDPMRATMTGAYGGLSHLASGAQVGASRMLADIGSLMPPIAPPQQHPYIQARHGMYAQEMTLTGGFAAMFGRGIPQSTTAYEYNQMASRDVGQRIGNAAGMTAIYGGAAAAGTAAFMGLARFGAMGIVGGIATAVGIDALANKVAGDVKDRQEVMNFLEASSFRYATGTGSDIDKRFGAGFNRQARASIAKNIKNIDLGDSAFDMSDLKGILESGTELGMFEGARSAEEFSAKFKDLTKTLKAVTRTLHQSLAEGMKTIKDLKDQGFRTGEAQLGAITTADILGTATGRTAAEMLSVGRQGSEMVRGTGIGLSTGSTMLQQTTAMTNMMQQSGALTPEMIAQAGGAGPLAQKMMAGNINFMRTQVGRGAMMAMTGPEGRFDPGAFQQLASGEFDLSQLANRASGNLSEGGVQGFVRGVINRDKNMREMSTQFGDMGIQFAAMGTRIAGAQSMSSQLGISVEEALRFQMTTGGLSESEIEGQIGMLKNVDAFRTNQQQAFRIQASKAAGEIIRARTDVIGKMSDRFERTFIAPMSNAAGDIIDNISDKVENARETMTDIIHDKIFGIKKVQTQAISNERADEVLLSGFGEDPGADLAARSYRRNIFSDKERENFAETEAYAELDTKFGENATSAEALRSGDLKEYSKAVTSKGWGRLSKEEKMYVADQADRMGMTKIKEEIDRRGLKSELAIKDRRFATLEEGIKKREDAKSDLKSARSKAVQKLAAGDDDLEEALGEVLQSESGGLVFDKLVTTQAEVKKLEAQKERFESAGMTLSEAEAEKLKTSKAKLTSFKRTIIGQLHKQGSSGKAAARQFAKNIGEADLGGVAFEVEGAKQILDDTAMVAQQRQMLQEADEFLDTIDMSKLGGFAGVTGEQKEFSAGIEELRDVLRGTSDANVTDIQKMARLAGKAGNAALAGMFSRAGDIQKKGGIQDADEIRRVLNLSDKVSDEKIRGAFGKSLDAQEFLKHEGIRDFSVRSGMTRVKGGDATGAELKEEAKTIQALVDSQRRIASITNQLEALATRLEKRVGGR